MPRTKSDTIFKWKSRGLIYNDYDELYEIYIKTTNCWYCQKEFKNSSDRCMDHDHSTGLFRKIVCRACNNCDSYIKYPNGYEGKAYHKQYRTDHKEKIIQYHKKYYEECKEQLKQKRNQYYKDNKETIKQKISCLCGSVIRKDNMKDHLNTQLHLNKMDKYMENID